MPNPPDPREESINFVVNLIDVPLNRVGEKPTYRGEWICKFCGTEYINLRGAEHFIPFFTIVRVEYKTPAEVQESFDKTEPYRVLETRKIRAFDLVEQFSPASCQTNEEVQAWRSSFAEQMSRDKAIFEQHREHLRQRGQLREQQEQTRRAEEQKRRELEAALL
jgi:hypothetical protein